VRSLERRWLNVIPGGEPEGEAMRSVVIMGAGGRDFHDFNVVYRDDPTTKVLAFTAAQIPGIENRVYPASLAGRERVDEVVLATRTSRPIRRATHELHETGQPKLASLLQPIIDQARRPALAAAG
jgi:predicted GTPase